MHFDKPDQKDSLIRKKEVCLSILTAGVVVCAWFSSLIFSPMPPMKTIQHCLPNLDKAGRMEAERYAPVWFHAAQESWKKLLEEWRFQNNLYPSRRNFSRVHLLADSVNECSARSSTITLFRKDSLRMALAADLWQISMRLKKLSERYHLFPVNPSIERKINQHHLSFIESQRIYREKEYRATARWINPLKNTLNKTEKELESAQNKFFQRIPEWRRWARDWIAWSKENQNVALIINKSAHTCILVRSGNIENQYKVEMGPHWYIPKSRAGDGATPEGKYFITGKKNARETRFYKALDISYPNDEDRRRNYSMYAGESQNTPLGGDIEIHGQGGLGFDWTQGCIALKNEDMDMIYQAAEIGTPVIIVGSL